MVPTFKSPQNMPLYEEVKNCLRQIYPARILHPSNRR